MADRVRGDIDNLQDRVTLLEQQSVLIARMDENIQFIKNQIEGGSDKFVKVDDQIDDLEKDLEELKSNFNSYKASNQGKWLGASTLAVVVVGAVNILLLLLTLYQVMGR